MFKITTKDAYQKCWCLGSKLPVGKDFEYENTRVEEIAIELHVLETVIMQLKEELRQIYISESD